MASEITLLKSFTDGQGAGAQTYVIYDGDLDSNFATIEAAHNILVTEVKASGATNSALIFDMLQSASPLILKGIVGKDSFHTVTFPTTTSMTIPGGVALAASSRVNALETTLFSSTTDSWWVALNQNGTITLETAADQGVLDIYTIDTTGAGVFTQASLTLIADVMPDGDDFQNQKIVLDDSQAALVGIPEYTYDVIADRLNDIHKNMIGVTTSGDADQTALNGLAISGAVATPGLSLSNGSTTFENTTGLFRAAANELGVSVLATEVVRFAETTTDEPQARMRAGTALATPPIAWSGDVDNGFGYVSANVHRAIAGGVEAFRFAVDGANGVRAAFVADPDTGSNPGLAVIGDLDTGLLSTGANTLQAMTGGVVALDLSSLQQVSSDTQFRLDVTTSAEAHGTGTAYSPISMDTEVTDIGGWGAAPTSTWTVPTGGAGFYCITGTVVFDESVGANAGTVRNVAVSVGGTPIAQDRRAPRGSGTLSNAASVSVVMEVAAGVVIELEAAQDSGGSENVDGRLSIVRLW